MRKCHDCCRVFPLREDAIDFGRQGFTSLAVTSGRVQDSSRVTQKHLDFLKIAFAVVCILLFDGLPTWNMQFPGLI